MTAAHTASAQVPVIDSMDIDESTGSLLIHGIHGNEAGSVRVDGVQLTVQSWTDTLITCTIPDTGKGSYGPTIVANSHGTTRPRLITKWHFNIFGWHAPPQNPFSQVERERYYLDWRFDLHSRLLAKVGYTNAYLTPMRSSWHVDTIMDGHTFRNTDTIIERPFTNVQIVFWYLHPFQDGHGEILSVPGQSGICLFDSNFKIRPYHDTVKSSQGVWIAENNSDGSVEFAPPPQAVWLMEQSTLKYESIIQQTGRVGLEWWFIPWAESYELLVTRVQPDKMVVIDTIITNPTFPLIDHVHNYTNGLYVWAVRGLNSEGAGVWSSRTFSLGTFDVAENDASTIALLDEPVGSTMRFRIPVGQPDCRARIFDALGGERTLRGRQTAEDRYEIDAIELPSGVYMYDLSVGGRRITGRAIVKH